MELFEHWGLQVQVLATTGFAMLLGGAIGFERELKNRPAGFRTHMLVAGACAMLVGLVDLLAQRYAGETYRELVRIDPIRLIEAAVAAVGFLGAGTIFRSGTRGDGIVSGITTAASLLMVAVIGVAAGVHAHVLAIGATTLTLAVLFLLGWIERRAGGESRDP